MKFKLKPQFYFFPIFLILLSGVHVGANSLLQQRQASQDYFFETLNQYLRSIEAGSDISLVSSGSAKIFINELSIQQKADVLFEESTRFGFVFGELHKQGEDKLLMELANSIDFSNPVGNIDSDTFGEFLVRGFGREPFLRTMLEQGFIKLNTLPLSLIDFLVSKVWGEESEPYIYNFKAILESNYYGPQPVSKQNTVVLADQAVAQLCLYQSIQKFGANSKETLNPSIYPLINDFRAQILSKFSAVAKQQSNYYNMRYNNGECELFFVLTFEFSGSELKVHSLYGGIRSIQLGQKADLKFEDIAELSGLGDLLTSD